MTQSVEEQVALRELAEKVVHSVGRYAFAYTDDAAAKVVLSVLRAPPVRAILALPALHSHGEGEEFLEFKEALSDLRSLRQENRDLSGGGPGWGERWAAAWAKADELFADEDEAAWERAQEGAWG